MESEKIRMEPPRQARRKRQIACGAFWKSPRLPLFANVRGGARGGRICAEKL